MEIKRNDLLGILGSYYTKFLGHEVKVKEKHEIEYVGLYDNKEAVITLYCEETVDILGHNATKTTIISKEEIKEILNKLIKESGYIIDSITYKKGVTLGGTQYYEIEEAYFDGIELTIREKGKELVKK